MLTAKLSEGADDGCHTIEGRLAKKHSLLPKISHPRRTHWRLVCFFSLGSRHTRGQNVNVCQYKLEGTLHRGLQTQKARRGRHWQKPAPVRNQWNNSRVSLRLTAIPVYFVVQIGITRLYPFWLKKTEYNSNSLISGRGGAIIRPLDYWSNVENLAGYGDIIDALAWSGPVIRCCRNGAYRLAHPARIFGSKVLN